MITATFFIKNLRKNLKWAFLSLSGDRNAQAVGI